MILHYDLISSHSPICLFRLGDRHAENILFDSSNGDCVHVDVNMLFDKGQQLNVPEIVPFRLTQNLVDGMGVLGYEGKVKNNIFMWKRMIINQGI